ncbi:histidine phosphatase family protein [Halobacillus salinarum]|uniref:Histidine phosphatase family protein n=1 Tax=Halobacillus salinarum TaxID=2932257 RepID=A0ABY4ELC4_9BACI|nr:histidine phosphatase family protein [Halobacillus salinarum]UOQ44780.1 histidine phosphatase family protein [Halobacillus salinarum]
MTKIYLTRHGQTEWNVEGRMQGTQDSALTSLGVKQAEWLGSSLQSEPMDLIISSSSGRAVKTAELIRGTRNIPLETNDRLKEINLGEWEGRLQSQIQKFFPYEYKHFWEEPHLYESTEGEDFAEVIERAGRELEQLALDNEGKTILVVTHAVVLKCLMAYFEEKPVRDVWSGAYMHSTSLSLVERAAGEWKVHFQGDTAHHEASSSP